ncbi:phosphoribosylformylglycinamidine synthase subunit PurS [Marisediminicola senii]|uniref:phosphoribosylformylglycinamidine synthase subunit PurS n=1 Tax=Marisediminicola senii TaxID=2711233 RepID=UPI0013EBBA9E|nr:phosphoribosylformylglycinamidine synthase subunit PurS [Marisediminicola senii]
MPTIIVEVMPKAELLDPQGKAVTGALSRLGSRFTGVRIGKRFELSFDGPMDDAALDDARALADSMLSNSVIEDVVSVAFAPGLAGAAASTPASVPSETERSTLAGN